MANLTQSEIRILQFYRTFKSERFCCSIKTIANACSVGTKTVQRANARFQAIGILAWVPGNSASWNPNSRGQANRYRLKLSGIEGFDIPASQARTLRSQTNLNKMATPNNPSRPNNPNDLVT